LGPALLTTFGAGRRRVRQLRHRALRAWRQRHDPLIRPHIGQVIERRLLLGGRVLREGAPAPTTATSPRWRNLLNTYRSFVHVKVVGARLLAQFGDAEAEVLTDHDGYFSVELELPSPVEGPGWQKVLFRLVEAPGYTGPTVTAEGLVRVHRVRARFAVISDIDDTVLASHVTSRFRMMLRVLLSNAHTRMPFAGVGAFYRALEEGLDDENNPIFYVSNGPWNLHDLLVEFFRLNGVPLGPISLRDWGAHLVLARKPAGTHKRLQITRIMAFFPGLPVILIGDSGEHDPEIFTRIAQQFPGRVAAIYIRCVHRDRTRPESMQRLWDSLAGKNIDCVLVADSEAAAVHAASRGFIAPLAIETVRRDKRETAA
jgi:phosphatidate phosphatase APP1